MKLVPLRPYGS